MSPGWYGRGAGNEVAEDAHRGRYRYDGVLLFWAMGAAAATGIFLLIVMIGGSGQVLARVWVSVVGAYGVWYAYRRVTSPIEFVIHAGVVRGIYLRGKVTEWQQADVAIRPRTFLDVMDGSQRVVDSRSGKVVFRVFIDLPALSHFAENLRGENAAA